MCETPTPIRHQLAISSGSVIERINRKSYQKEIPLSKPRLKYQ